MGWGLPGGQGVGSPPPSKDAVFAKAVVSRIETAEQRPKSKSAASEILIFINSLLRHYPLRAKGIYKLSFYSACLVLSRTLLSIRELRARFRLAPAEKSEPSPTIRRGAGCFYLYFSVAAS